MPRKFSILISLAVSFGALVANAAVSPVNVSVVSPAPSFNGSCVINWVNVTKISAPQAATVDFSCTGSFYNQVYVNIHLEDPTFSTGSVGSVVSSGFYGSVDRTYPWNECSYVSTFSSCFNAIHHPIPAEDTLSTSANTLGRPFKAVATVKWDVGHATCYWWGCVANQQSVTASTVFYTP